MTNRYDEELLDSRRASEYLAQKWGLDSWSLPAFKMHYKRWGKLLGIQPAAASKSATFWRRSDLDKLPKPDKSRPRPSRRKKRDSDSEGSSAGQQWDSSAAGALLTLARAG